MSTAGRFAAPDQRYRFRHSTMQFRETIQVTLDTGLHLRPLQQISEVAGRFSSEVRIVNGQTRADAKSMLDMMTLSAVYGSELAIEIDGDDAEDARREVMAMFDAILNEGE